MAYNLLQRLCTAQPPQEIVQQEAPVTQRLPPPERFAFIYRGCSMVCTAEFLGLATYRPVVFYRSGLPELEATTVPVIGASCASTSAAILRGQQTAMLWINERTQHLNWWF